MVHCQVCGAQATEKNRRPFHRFPIRDRERCQKWIAFCNKERLQNLPSTALRRRFICSAHFDPSMHMGPQSNKLMPFAFPTKKAPPTTRPELLVKNKAESSQSSAEFLVKNKAEPSQSSTELLVAIKAEPSQSSTESLVAIKAEPSHPSLSELLQSSEQELNDKVQELLPLSKQVSSLMKSELDPVSQLCRLCTKPAGEDAVDLFGEQSQIILPMLNSLLPQPCTEVDGLSQLACTICIERVNTCYITVQTFVEADAKLREMLNTHHKQEQMELEVGLINTESSPVADGSTDNVSDAQIYQLLMNGGSNTVKEKVEAKNKHTLMYSNKELDEQILKIVSESVSNAARRKLEEKNKRTLMCSICKRLFTDMYLAQYHKKKEAETNAKVSLLRVKLKCCHCDNLFLNEASLIEHRKEDRTEESLLCYICGKTMQYKAQIDRHIYYHETRREKAKHVCDVCDRKFWQTRDWKTHLLWHERQTLSKTSPSCVCYMCGKVFKNNYSLLIHERTHKNELEPVSCPHCNKRLRNRVHLRSHLDWVHSGKKKKLCHLCGATLSSPHLLKIHLHKHWGLPVNTRRFKCNLCEKSFQWKFKLSRHMRRHTGQKEFACNTCNKQFYSKELLRQHMVTHSLLRIHKCAVCQVTFKSKKYLVTHRKKVNCTLAQDHTYTAGDKNVALKRTLKKHLKSNSLVPECNESVDNTIPSLEFLCMACDSYFVSEDELLIHINKEHCSESWPLDSEITTQYVELEFNPSQEH